MNKLTKLITLVALLFVTIFSFVGNTNSAQAAPTAGFTTTVNIHKIESDQGRKLTADELEKGITDMQGHFGADAKAISGVVFDIYNVTQAEYEEMVIKSADYKTKAQVESFVENDTATSTAATDVNGLTKVDLNKGYYWIIEQPLTTVATSKAVPFGLTLPYTNTAGDQNLSEIHVYPKNTLVDEAPTVSKRLDENSSSNGSQYIGQEFAWTVTSDVPTGIKEYSTYSFTDTLDPALDYVRVVLSSPTTLIVGTDYQVAYDASARTVTVSLTKLGIAKLTKDDTIQFNIVTKMNQEAIANPAIKNTISVTYKTPHTNGPVTIKNLTPAQVVTGTHTFNNINDAGENVSDAEFVVQRKNPKNDKIEFIVVDSTSKEISFTPNQSEATTFTSDANGNFTVNGLAYGDYTAIQTKAASNYALPTTPKTEFTVSANNTPTIIKHKSITIPQTGGMGTILFTIVGLALMIFAVVYYKKSNPA